MRAAYVIPEFPALSETFILNQITGLRDLGVQVDIYASAPRMEAAVHPDVAAYRLLESTYHIPLMQLGMHGAIGPRTLYGFALLLRRLSGDPACTAGSAGRGDAAPAPGGAAAVWRMTRRGLAQARLRSYDVVHAHYGVLGAMVLRLQRCGFLRGPVVTSFHGYDVSMYLRRAGPEAYRGLFRRGAAFLPVTEYWARRLLGVGCPPDRTRVHRMAVDLRRFHFRPPRAASRDGGVRLLSVGRLVEKKGFEYGLEAVAALLPEFPGLRYDIVGEGPLRGELERGVAARGLGGAVRLLGAMERPRVIERMRAADIFLAPSVTASDGDMEGLPVALMEAVAVGLPVVSTRHSGIPELVQDGVTGFLAEERDGAGLAEKLRRLLAAPHEWMRLAERARAKVETEFNIDNQVRKLLDLYRAVARKAC